MGSNTPSSSSRRRALLYGRRKGPKLSAHKEELRRTLLPKLALRLEQGVDPSTYFLPPPRGEVEAVLSVDERGQMVLPKDVREKAGIKTGDKLALISWSRDGDVCCLALMKVENLNGMVKDILSPLMQESEKK